LLAIGLTATGVGWVYQYVVHSREAPYVGAFFLLRWLVQTDTHKATS